MRRAWGSVVEARASCTFAADFLALDLGQFLQSRFHALDALLCRPLPRGFLPLASSSTVAIEFGLEGFDLLAGFLQKLFQLRPATERTASGRGANAEPVLGDPFELHHARLEKRGDRVRQQAVQKGLVLNAEVGQRVVIQGNAPADPLVRRVRFAQPIQFAGAADPLDRGIQPQRQENPRVGSRPAHRSLDRLKFRQQGRKVQTVHVIPNHPGPMILGDQVVHRLPMHHDLIADRTSQTRLPLRRGLWRSRLRHEIGLIEQRRRHEISSMKCVDRFSAPSHTGQCCRGIPSEKLHSLSAWDRGESKAALTWPLPSEWERDKTLLSVPLRGSG